ncbi:MAG TPA: CMP-binding protein, partial [Phycisphaerae bacterium]|nr:CMP-binding protein [Phycisphaerae bacterium]
GELTAGTAINYTDRGQLIGHITIAAIWVQEKANLLSAEMGEPFPPKTLDLLQHLILSHHGVHEYGSPKLPMIPEAYFLHYLDNLDAKMYMTTHKIANDPDAESTFTSYHRQLETRLYKGSGELD